MLKQRAIPKTVPTGLKDTFITVYMCMSRSQCKCTSGLQKHMVFVCLHALF